MMVVLYQINPVDSKHSWKAKAQTLLFPGKKNVVIRRLCTFSCYLYAVSSICLFKFFRS